LTTPLVHSGDSTRIDQAIALAHQVHAGQVDKQGQPYILHALRVGLALHWAPANWQIVGFLHDAIEDGPPGTAAYIEAVFGPDVYGAVGALTHARGDPYLAYIARLRGNPIARVVKYEDIEDNLRRVESIRDDADRQRLRRKYEGALEVLGAQP